MYKLLVIVLKMIVWLIILILVFKCKLDDVMFYLKLDMYYGGWKFVFFKNNFILCSVLYVVCF